MTLTTKEMRLGIVSATKELDDVGLAVRALASDCDELQSNLDAMTKRAEAAERQLEEMKREHATSLELYAVCMTRRDDAERRIAQLAGLLWEITGKANVAANLHDRIDAALEGVVLS